MDKRKIIQISIEDIPPRKGIPVGFKRKLYHMQCLGCKKNFTITVKRYNQGVGMFCGVGCARKYSVGKNHHSYKHGKKTGFNEWRRIREKLILEKTLKCELCGYDKFPDIIEAHHRKPRSHGGLNTVKNGILVCPNCHKLIHRGIIDTNGKILLVKGKGIHNY